MNLNKSSLLTTKVLIDFYELDYYFLQIDKCQEEAVNNVMRKVWMAWMVVARLFKSIFMRFMLIKTDKKQIKVHIGHEKQDNSGFI